MIPLPSIENYIKNRKNESDGDIIKCPQCGNLKFKYGICPCSNVPTILAQKPSTQIGGNHYESKKIQPIEFIEANNLGFHEGNAIKYIVRYKEKNGLEDLNKAKWYIERLIEIYNKGE